MTRLLLRWILAAVALIGVAAIVPGVKVTSFGAALICAFFLGLANAVLRPIIMLLILPIVLLTFGLIIPVINGLLFWWVANTFDGFRVTGFWPAFWGAIVYGLLTWLIDRVLEALERPR
jgi:putative membrane protein